MKKSLQKDSYPEFETTDHKNNIVILRKCDWDHIVERRGSQWHNYWESIKDTIENPDKFGISKHNSKTKVYIQEKNNKRQKYLSKYLIVFVTENIISTSYFSKELNGILVSEELK